MDLDKYKHATKPPLRDLAGMSEEELDNHFALMDEMWKDSNRPTILCGICFSKLELYSMLDYFVHMDKCLMYMRNYLQKKHGNQFSLWHGPEKSYFSDLTGEPNSKKRKVTPRATSPNETDEKCCLERKMHNDLKFKERKNSLVISFFGNNQRVCELNHFKDKEIVKVIKEKINQNTKTDVISDNDMVDEEQLQVCQFQFCKSGKNEDGVSCKAYVQGNIKLQALGSEKRFISRVDLFVFCSLDHLIGHMERLSALNLTKRIKEVEKGE